MMHKSAEELDQALADAAKLVAVGSRYEHYKHHFYTVLHLAIVEADSSVCVVYQAEYGSRVIFTRALSSWLEMVEVDGKMVERFKLVA